MSAGEREALVREFVRASLERLRGRAPEDEPTVVRSASESSSAASADVGEQVTR